jgi:hypothetical protein
MFDTVRFLLLRGCRDERYLTKIFCSPTVAYTNRLRTALSAASRYTAYSKPNLVRIEQSAWHELRPIARAYFNSIGCRRGFPTGREPLVR